MAVDLPTTGEDPWGDKLNAAILEIDAAVALQSVPPGGTTGQVLGKTSATDFDAAWATIPKITVAGTAPSSPAVNDVWIDVS